MKVFDWQRDELILALDLYIRTRPAAPGPDMPEIRALSDLLKSSGLHPREGRPASFRSVASVVMKLMNFRNIDPGYHGKGLSAGGREDRSVWQEFASDAIRLRKIAALIRGMLDAVSTNIPPFRCVTF
jgi:5-methylcytosine-specific restriction protein A